MSRLSPIEIELIELAQEEDPLDTDTLYRIQPHNSEEMIRYINAAEALHDQKYLVPMSRNIIGESFDLLTESAIVFYLTQSGINAYREIKADPLD